MTEKKISFTIPGSPVGKGRPRVSVRGGYAHAYTPEKTRTYEARVKAVAKAAMRFMGIRQVPSAPVRVSIVARFEWPQGDLNADGSLKEHKPGSKAAARVNDMKYARVVPGKPDIDNVVKAVLDALNGIAYQDDAQVSVLHAAKRWRDCDEEREPGVDVQIEWEE